MSLVLKNAYMSSENQQVLRLRLAYLMRRLLFVALTAGLLSPTAAIADTYEALCNNKDCQITINESGLEGPQGFIPKENIIQWYTGGDEYNLALGVAGGAAVSTAGYMGAVVTCLAGAVLCPVVAVGGILGGAKLGSRLGKGKNVFFTVMGKKDDGSNYIQSFRFLNKRTAKKHQKELIKFTGLQMGQIKSSG